MLGKLLAAILVAILALVAALYVACYVPEGVEGATQARISTMITTSAQKLAEYASRLGLGEEVRINQWFAQTFSHHFRGEDDPLVQTEKLEMAGTTVFIYHYMGSDNPKKAGLAPALVFIHGGGWVVMNTDYYHNALQRLVKESKLMLISIEYTLAPDSLFPGPVHENAKVVKHFLQNAHKFGNDKNRVIMIGDSAGGNLVAAVNLLLRDEKVQPRILAQVLVYPFLQYLDMALPSYQNGSVIITSKEICTNYGMWYMLGHNKYKTQVMANEHISAATLAKHQHKLDHKKLPKAYFPKHYRQQDRTKHKGISNDLDKLVTNPLFSPLMADDLSGLPRALVQTCYYDVLRDDGYLYAARLREAKVKVKYINYETSYHGAFLRNPMFVNDIITYIKDIL